MHATVMRSDGAGRPPLPRAVAGMIVGNPRTAALWTRKRRRDVFGAGDEGWEFIKEEDETNASLGEPHASRQVQKQRHR